MSDYDQSDVPCCGCGGRHEGTFVLVDLSDEGRGEHRPICYQQPPVLSPDGEVLEVIEGCAFNEAHRTKTMPSRYEIRSLRAHDYEIRDWLIRRDS